MPWKKIAKIVGSIIVGGGLGSGVVQDVPPEVVQHSLSPELIQVINTIVGAILGFLLMRTKSPKEE